MVPIRPDAIELPPTFSILIPPPAEFEEPVNIGG